MPSSYDRFPFLSASGKKQIEKRFIACWPAVNQTLGIPAEDLINARRLGCGNYGCTYLIPNLPPEKSVLKITTDNLEAHVVNLLTSWGEDKPDGIVHYEGIWQFGQCSVLPKMRPFVYKAYDRMRQLSIKYYTGLGAPYRPLWLIQREELPDVPKDVQKLLRAQWAGHGRGTDVLYHLSRWAHEYAMMAGCYPGSPGVPSITYKIEDEVLPRLKDVGGEALMEALKWLYEREIAFFDFQKIANLGWREGTGLVIRDIGFAANTSMGAEDITRLGGLR